MFNLYCRSESKLEIGEKNSYISKLLNMKILRWTNKVLITDLDKHLELNISGLTRLSFCRYYIIYWWRGYHPDKWGSSDGSPKRFLELKSNNNNNYYYYYILIPSCRIFTIIYLKIFRLGYIMLQLFSGYNMVPAVLSPMINGLYL